LTINPVSHKTMMTILNLWKGSALRSKPYTHYTTAWYIM